MENNRDFNIETPVKPETKDLTNREMVLAAIKKHLSDKIFTANMLYDLPEVAQIGLDPSGLGIVVTSLHRSGDLKQKKTYLKAQLGVSLPTTNFYTLEENPLITLELAQEILREVKEKKDKDSEPIKKAEKPEQTELNTLQLEVLKILQKNYRGQKISFDQIENICKRNKISTRPFINLCLTKKVMGYHTQRSQLILSEFLTI